VNRDTGLTLEQLGFVEDLCHQELVEIPVRSPPHPKLSPRNILILTLKWLRRYPATEDLAQEFNVSQRKVVKYVNNMLDVLDLKLEYLRRWPLEHRSKILKGPLQGTIGAVDTFPICIYQPECTDDRKRFYIYKPGHHTRYGYKVQTFVALNGMILDVTNAYPFGSKADIALFRESNVSRKLDPNTRAMAPAPDTLVARLENRIANCDPNREESTDEPDNKHSIPTHEEDEEDDSKIPNISRALTETKALGDKAYIGSKLIYAPYKKFKGKRFTKAKKDFNKLLSTKRVIVENVNKRLEDFRVLGTIYRGARDAELVSKIVRVVVSLHNLMVPSHPLRRRRPKSGRSA
jgi:hypothetical protein